ncbi:hypothetical protein HMPREF1624_08610 [Sporothrix schenckii ATCC 58251]|uniref:HNH nuclease domain-containing protein n=1 Tax=Sporothrix schenckii (strain ATCC 58251 / de Perez 2211183) TaxID=1391915 RepID=U7PHQ6_SPOS1|nr:hypothetical protein HMPREF1624_08610 [Sporothrix schenckii ATCC 58251]
MALAIIAVLPVHQLLRVERTLSQDDNLLGFHSFTWNTTQAVRIFLQKPGVNMPLRDPPLNRRQAEREICLLRDRDRCLVTGTANLEVCHIFPFATNNSSDKVGRLLQFEIASLSGAAGDDNFLYEDDDEYERDEDEGEGPI